MPDNDNKATGEMVWLTYQQVAERLGLPTAAAARAKARRAGWPKRPWGNAGEVAVGVPPSLLVSDTEPAAPARPASTPAAAALDALRHELAAVRGDLSRETGDRRSLQQQADELRDRLAVAEVRAAGYAATARAEQERRQAAEAALAAAQDRLEQALEAARRPWWRRLL